MPMIERAENRTELDVSSPTTLHLFRPKENERPALRSIANSVEQFTNNAKGTFEFLEKLDTAGMKQINRLLQAEEELDRQDENLGSSITCGTVFLKMQAELPHLSPPELMDFFKLCLRIDIEIGHTVNAITTAKNTVSVLRNALLYANDLKGLADKLRKIYDLNAGNPPAWFKESKNSWNQFLQAHSCFPTYLNPTFIPNLYSAYSQKPFRKLGDNDLACVISGEYPDWLDDNQAIPTRETVQQEIDEDLSERKRITQEKERINHQKKYIKDSFIQKNEKAQKWYEAQIQRLFSKKGAVGFLDQLLALYLLSNTKKPIERIIQVFSQDKYLASNPQPIALFIEKTMTKSGIVKSAQTPIDSNFINNFSLMLLYMQEQSEEFQGLKEKNKKVFKGLNYDIKPLLKLLTPDEISYLRELLTEYKDSPAESFIWDIAEAVSSHLKKAESEEKEEQKSQITDSLRKPTASFLRNNWEWAYGQFKESLLAPDAQFALPLVAETSDQIEVKEELTSSIKEIQEGNLSKWHILYSINRTTDPKHLVEIPGATLEEREEELERFFQTEDIHPSIKISSIINAFDHLQITPEEVEWIRMRKTVNGEVFRKIKRGKGRIFYIMDFDKKELVFFYVQKKAQNYNF